MIDLSTEQLRSMPSYVNEYNIGVTPISESLGACRAKLRVTGCSQTTEAGLRRS
jgi:hypothetical protein